MILKPMRSMAATQLRSVIWEVETPGYFVGYVGSRRRKCRLQCSNALGKAPETRRQFASLLINITVYQVLTVSGAVEKTRTSTGYYPTTTSTLRVYQFRHDR